MTPETRRLALHAARAIAGLGVVACSPAAPPEAATVPASEVPARLLPPASSAPASAPPGSAESCSAIVDRYFADDADDYAPTKHVTAPPDVTRCCLTALSDHGKDEDAQKIFAAHRWTCCTTVDGMRHPEVNIACSPWGPPVPPRMEALARRRERRRQA
jgi:hypothetical protein